MSRPASTSARRPLGIVILTTVLGLQSAAALAFGISVSLLVGSLLPTMATGAQFLSAAAVVFGVVAFFTARGVWRLRAWSFAWAAMLQVVVALAVAVALVAGGFAPQLAWAIGLTLVAVVALSVPSTREALSPA
jgi:hypothetical protein